MKQTVEEAARDYAICATFDVIAQDNIAMGFIAGVEWQAKQLPWISVEERLPEKDGYYLVTNGVHIAVAYFFKCWDKFAKYESYPHPFYKDDAIKLFMPIPTFDQILEDNKDVLINLKGN